MRAARGFLTTLELNKLMAENLFDLKEKGDRNCIFYEDLLNFRN